MVLMNNENTIYFRSSECSINELREISKDIPVIRTAHPGNFDYVTLAIAKEFPVLLREDIIGDASVYEPGYIREGQNRIAITKDLKSAVPFLQINDPNSIREKYSLEARTALQMHYTSLRQLDLKIAPAIEAITDIVCLDDLISVVAADCPEHFDMFYDGSHQRYRLVKNRDHINIYTNARGEERSVTQKDLPGLYSAHIKVVRNSYEGEIKEDIPSVDVSNTLFHVMLIASYFSKDKWLEQVYHLCGTRMYNYLYRDSRYAASHQSELEEVYRTISKFGFVPKNIVFNLVPTTQLKPFVKIGEENPEQAYKVYREYLEKDYLWNKKKRKIVQEILQEPPWNMMNTREEVARKVEYELLNRGIKPKVRRRINNCITQSNNVPEAKGYAISCLYPASLFPKKDETTEGLESILKFSQQRTELGSQYEFMKRPTETPSLPDFICRMNQKEITAILRRFLKIQKLL